jgi:hypothetical protein
MINPCIEELNSHKNSGCAFATGTVGRCTGLKRIPQTQLTAEEGLKRRIHLKYWYSVNSIKFIRIMDSQAKKHSEGAFS